MKRFIIIKKLILPEWYIGCKVYRDRELATLVITFWQEHTELMNEHWYFFNLTSDIQWKIRAYLLKSSNRISALTQRYLGKWHAL